MLPRAYGAERKILFSTPAERLPEVTGAARQRHALLT